MTGHFLAFELDELEKKHAAAGPPYSEFLRRRANHPRGNLFATDFE